MFSPLKQEILFVSHVIWYFNEHTCIILCMSLSWVIFQIFNDTCGVFSALKFNFNYRKFQEFIKKFDILLITGLLNMSHQFTRSLSNFMFSWNNDKIKQALCYVNWKLEQVNIYNWCMTSCNHLEFVLEVIIMMKTTANNNKQNFLMISLSIFLP